MNKSRYFTIPKQEKANEIVNRQLFHKISDTYHEFPQTIGHKCLVLLNKGYAQCCV